MASVQGHPCRYQRGLTPTQVSTGLNEEDTTAKVEGATSWGRCSGVATQRSSAQSWRESSPTTSAARMLGTTWSASFAGTEVYQVKWLWVSAW